MESPFVLLHVTHSFLRKVMQYDDLSKGIINCRKQTVFQEKHLCLFSKLNGGYCVYYPSNKLDNTQIFPSFS